MIALSIKPKRLAVVGCGARSESDLHALREDLGQCCELVALADQDRCQVYLRHFGQSTTRIFPSATALHEAMGDQIYHGMPGMLHPA